MTDKLVLKKDSIEFDPPSLVERSLDSYTQDPEYRERIIGKLYRCASTELNLYEDGEESVLN